MGKFDEDGMRPVDDPFAELFAECKTEEDVLRLIEEIKQLPTPTADGE